MQSLKARGWSNFIELKEILQFEIENGLDFHRTKEEPRG